MSTKNEQKKLNDLYDTGVLSHDEFYAQTVLWGAILSDGGDVEVEATGPDEAMLALAEQWPMLQVNGLNPAYVE